MTVVLRCPNCGTTRATPGECEACHEAEVRSFCTNHTPGRWLDTTSCPECGARLGEPPRASAAATPASVRPTRPSSPARAPARAARSSSAPPAPYPRASRPRIGAGAWTGSRPATHDTEAEAGSDTPRLLPWQKLLLAAVRARYMPTRVSAARERAPIGRGLGGCLRRVLLVVVLLFVAIAGAAVLFGQALLSG